MLWLPKVALICFFFSVFASAFACSMVFYALYALFFNNVHLYINHFVHILLFFFFFACRCASKGVFNSAQWWTSWNYASQQSKANVLPSSRSLWLTESEKVPLILNTLQKIESCKKWKLLLAFIENLKASVMLLLLLGWHHQTAFIWTQRHCDSHSEIKIADGHCTRGRNDLWCSHFLKGH